METCPSGSEGGRAQQCARPTRPYRGGGACASAVLMFGIAGILGTGGGLSGVTGRYGSEPPGLGDQLDVIDKRVTAQINGQVLAVGPVILDGQ
jgi:hypothetical protein